MLKKLFCLLFLVLCFCHIHGQEVNDVHAAKISDGVTFIETVTIVVGSDSINHFLEMFIKNFEEGDTESAIYYGSRFKEEWDRYEAYRFDSTTYLVLEILANLYRFQGNIEKAVPVLSDLLVAREKSCGKNNVEYIRNLIWLAECHAELDNLSEAIVLFSTGLDITRKVLGTEHPYYTSLLNNLAKCFSDLGDSQKAIRMYTEKLETEKYVFGTEHPYYALSLNNLSSYNLDLGNYQEAIRLGTEALETCKKAFGTVHPNYASLLNNLSLCYSALGNYQEAIRLSTEALEIDRKILSSDDPSLATALSNLAGYYSDISNYTESMSLYSEALEIQRKVLGTKHPDYANTLNNYSLCYSALGNYHEAIRLCTEALEIRKMVFGSVHSTCAISLGNLSEYHSHLGNYHEAIRLGTEALEIQKKIIGTEHPDYANTLNHLSSYYSHLGNYHEAIRLCTEALEIQKKVIGMEHPESAITLYNLSSINSHLGNYHEAIRLCTETLEIQKKIFGTEHPIYAMSLNNLSLYYSALGNYHEAIRLCSEALDIFSRLFDTEHPQTSILLNNLSSYNSALGNYQEAIRLSTEALEVCKKAFGTEHPNYAMTLNSLARYIGFTGNYHEAVRLCSEALVIVRKVFGTEHNLFAIVLDDLSYYYSQNGNLTEAINLCLKALKIIKNNLGIEHPYYSLYLNNLSVLYFKLGNYFESYNYGLQTLQLSKDFLISSFSELSSGMQETLWASSNSFRFNSLFPSMVFRYRINDSISELYDMSALFAKGILLNTGIEMRRLILESGDLQLLDKYDEMVANKRFYEKLLDKPISERVVNVDSLRSVIDRQEMELARDSKAYGDFSRNLRITWQEVQGKLDDDDIAIEFLDFPIYGTDSTMYVALSLRKGYDCPRMIPLFEKVQLDSLPDDRHYTSSSLYDLVWQPLEEELVDVKDIYFSPSGELHRIGIEYVPITETENICDRYRLHRLSSTRQLAFTGDNIEAERAVLYGGLDYEAETERNPLNTSSDNTRGFRLAPRSNVDSLDVRGAVSYLPSTKEETDHIASDMKRYKVPYMSYSGRSGTEESFKSLDGTRLRILHIATHGFYLTEQEDKEQGFSRPMLHGTETVYREDKPMTRSGLLLSGCRPALNHEVVPEGVEDGILTAQEISRLDLRGLDLVVLSACQTGLGDITSGEGVFGLQRGFKNAGARTIVMSLWKVDDRATQKLMVIFYRNYLKGMDKEEAFRQAREELRRKNSSSRNRPDWAAFVMLDGCI